MCWSLDSFEEYIFIKACTLKKIDEACDEFIKPEDQWSCKRSPDILA